MPSFGTATASCPPCEPCPDPPFLTTEQVVMYAGVSLFIYVLDAFVIRGVMRLGAWLLRKQYFGNTWFLRILMGRQPHWGFVIWFYNAILQTHGLKIVKRIIPAGVWTRDLYWMLRLIAIVLMKLIWIKFNIYKKKRGQWGLNSRPRVLLLN